MDVSRTLAPLARHLGSALHPLWASVQRLHIGALPFMAVRPYERAELPDVARDERHALLWRRAALWLALVILVWLAVARLLTIDDVPPLSDAFGSVAQDLENSGLTDDVVHQFTTQNTMHFLLTVIAAMAVATACSRWRAVEHTRSLGRFALFLVFVPAFLLAWTTRDDGGWTFYTPFTMHTTKAPSTLPTFVIPALIGICSGAATGLRTFLTSERRTPWANPVLVTMGLGQALFGLALAVGTHDFCDVNEVPAGLLPIGVLGLAVGGLWTAWSACQTRHPGLDPISLSATQRRHAPAIRALNGAGALCLLWTFQRCELISGWDAALALGWFAVASLVTAVAVLDTVREPAHPEPIAA